MLASLAMNRLAHHFTTMAYNNAWANMRLLSATARLSGADFVAPRAGFFPSLKATLNHTLTVDWYYVDALERALRGQPPNPDALGYFEPEEPFSTCAELTREQQAVDRRLIDLCASLTDGQLDTPVGVTRRHGVVSERATRLLAHLFQHQIHHRGQAHAMLSSTHVAPPQLDDFFCAADADLRASELAELGTSERQLWSPHGSPTGEAPTRRELVDFLRAQPWAVQASVSQALSPQAAVIGVVVTDQLELFFDTLNNTRKYQNLTARPEIALVIGWDEGRTVQLQGQVDEPASDELARLKERYFARFPDGREREAWPGIAYLRVRPTWLRYSDFRGAQPLVFERTAAELAGE